MLKLSVVKNDCYRLIRALRHVKVKWSPSEYDIRRRAGGGSARAAELGEPCEGRRCGEGAGREACGGSRPLNSRPR